MESVLQQGHPGGPCAFTVPMCSQAAAAVCRHGSASMWPGTTQCQKVFCNRCICLLTLPWLCCLQFKNPPDYSELNLDPAQFEQYKLHADADRTAKMHSAVRHVLSCLSWQCSLALLSQLELGGNIGWPPHHWRPFMAHSCCKHVCLGSCLQCLEKIAGLQMCQIWSCILPSILPAAAAWTAWGCLEGQTSAVPCCTLLHPAGPCNPGAASSKSAASYCIIVARIVCHSVMLFHHAGPAASSCQMLTVWSNLGGRLFF